MTNIIWSLLYVESKNERTNEPTNQPTNQRTEFIDRENRLVVARGIG